MLQLEKIKDIYYVNDDNTSIAIITTDNEQLIFGIDHEFITGTVLKNYTLDDIENNTLKFKEELRSIQKQEEEDFQNELESVQISKLFEYKDILYKKRFVAESTNNELKQTLRTAEDKPTCHLVATLMLLESVFDMKVADYAKLTDLLQNIYDEEIT